MTKGDRVEDVDEIRDDDSELVKRVKDLASMPANANISLDAKWKEGTNFQSAEPSVCAVLIKKNSATGAVRVFSDPVTNVVTGPNQEPGVVLIVLKDGEECMLLGRPSVRWFSRPKNISD